MAKTKRKAPAARSASTALVRVAERLDAAVRRVKAPAGLQPAPAADALTESISLGALGLVEIKLTAREEAILAEPVKTDDILIKPSGQIYISHPTYTAWFNRAFGRLRWKMVPVAKPARTDSGVLMPYVMYIHGKPAAFAMGEQDYFENNREQTYGDAVEATVANAMRRCAKRLGVSLELWNKRFINRFIEQHCICVKVESRGDKPTRAWRRVDDPPFYNEVDRAKAGDSDAPRETQRPRPAPPAATGHRPAGALITEAQLKRLWTIIRKCGRTEQEIKSWLMARYRLDSTKAIPMEAYDAIVRAVESSGELPPSPEQLAREAGAEG